MLVARLIQIILETFATTNTFWETSTRASNPINTHRDSNACESSMK
jgi:hypothetical protein